MPINYEIMFLNLLIRKHKQKKKSDQISYTISTIIKRSKITPKALEPFNYQN